MQDEEDPAQPPISEGSPEGGLGGTPVTSGPEEGRALARSFKLKRRLAASASMTIHYAHCRPSA